MSKSYFRPISKHCKNAICSQIQTTSKSYFRPISIYVKCYFRPISNYSKCYLHPNSNHIKKLFPSNFNLCQMLFPSNFKLQQMLFAAKTNHTKSYFRRKPELARNRFSAFSCCWKGIKRPPHFLKPTKSFPPPRKPPTSPEPPTDMSSTQAEDGSGVNRTGPRKRKAAAAEGAPAAAGAPSAAGAPAAAGAAAEGAGSKRPREEEPKGYNLSKGVLKALAGPKHELKSDTLATINEKDVYAATFFAQLVGAATTQKPVPMEEALAEFEKTPDTGGKVTDAFKKWMEKIVKDPNGIEMSIMKGVMTNAKWRIPDSEFPRDVYAGRKMLGVIVERLKTADENSICLREEQAEALKVSMESEKIQQAEGLKRKADELGKAGELAANAKAIAEQAVEAAKKALEDANKALEARVLEVAANAKESDETREQLTKVDRVLEGIREEFKQGERNVVEALKAVKSHSDAHLEFLIKYGASEAFKAYTTSRGASMLCNSINPSMLRELAKKLEDWHSAAGAGAGAGAGADEGAGAGAAP